mmetsp:Transcript_22450/g.47837  ORF Transcript_22450/g.47837 Transcript_22450/m.47837 type:complete len:271 (+) Transcript_22450:796-1608(+)
MFVITVTADATLAGCLEQLLELLLQLLLLLLEILVPTTELPAPTLPALGAGKDDEVKLSAVMTGPSQRPPLLQVLKLELLLTASAATAVDAVAAVETGRRSPDSMASSNRTSNKGDGAEDNVFRQACTCNRIAASSRNCFAEPRRFAMRARNLMMTSLGSMSSNAGRRVAQCLKPVRSAAKASSDSLEKLPSDAEAWTTAFTARQSVSTLAPLFVLCINSLSELVFLTCPVSSGGQEPRRCDRGASGTDMPLPLLLLQLQLLEVLFRLFR